jgi:hypothetical protein
MTDETSKPYDSGSKRLLALSAQALLDWLCPGLRFTGYFSEQLYSRKIEPDAMIEACNENNERELTHFEFQSSPDPDMAQRMLEYSTLAFGRYRCPVRSYVLYLRENNERPQAPLLRRHRNEKPYLWFDYEEIHLWKTPYRQILDENWQGLFPLVPLMEGGAHREVIEELITHFQPAHDTITKERLALTRLFASLAFDKNDIATHMWIERRFAMLEEILRDTYIYQHDVAVGLEQGREQERQNLQDILMSTIQARFPRLSDLAQKQLELIQDVTILRALTKKVSTASTQKEARKYLLTWQQTN